MGAASPGREIEAHSRALRDGKSLQKHAGMSSTPPAFDAVERTARWWLKDCRAQTTEQKTIECAKPQIRASNRQLLCRRQLRPFATFGLKQKRPARNIAEPHRRRQKPRSRP
jgi:hypothetical protein